MPRSLTLPDVFAAPLRVGAPIRAALVRRALAVLALASAGLPVACASTPSSSPSPSSTANAPEAVAPVPVRQPPPAPKKPAVDVAADLPLASRPGLVAHLEAPSQVPYHQSAVGLGGYPVKVRLTNVGATPLDLSGLVIRFSVAREGVSFPCRLGRSRQAAIASADSKGSGAARAGTRAASPPLVRREPTRIEPAESVTFEREVACLATVVGHYEMTVNVAFGNVPGDSAGAVSFDLVGDAATVPKPYPGRPSLYVALVGDPLVPVMSAARWREGAYAPVVVVTNAGSTPVELGSVQVSLSARTASGKPVPCADAAAAGGATRPGIELRKDGPSQLESGASYTVPVPLRCPAKSDGDYKVQGVVTLGGAPKAAGPDNGVPVGLSFKVSQDPALVTPQVAEPPTSETGEERAPFPRWN